MLASRWPRALLIPFAAGLLCTITTAGAASMSGGAGGTRGGAGPPPSTPESRAEAVANPSVVFLTIHWRGYVQIPSNHVHVHTGWVGPYEATASCSGFVASGSGYIVTAGHCVDDQSMTDGGKHAIIAAMLSEGVSKGVITRAEASSLQSSVESTGKVEARASGSPPERVVSVYQPAATARAAAGNRLAGQVVDFQTLRNGDVALLKVNAPAPLPVLQVAGQVPDDGTPVISAGYPGSVAAVTDTAVEPSFKVGSTSSRHTVNGIPFIEVSTPASPGMSGGPSFDTQGRVVGTVSFGPSGETQSFNFITDTSSVRAILARNQVANQLGPADLAYRAGLTDYYAGHYHDAVAQFDKVLAVQPDQASAREFRAKAITSYPNEVSTGPSPWLYGGIAAAVVVLAGGATALIFMRRRRAQPEAAGSGQAPMPGSGQAAAPGDGQAAEPRGGQAAAPGDGQAAAPGDGQAAAPGSGQVACPRCGAIHPADAHFCASCGYRFIA